MFKLRSLKRVVVLCVSVAVALVVSEVGLRLAGARPGVYTLPGEFKVVDSLILYKDFTTDPEGIYKYSSWITDSVLRYIDLRTGILNPNTTHSISNVDGIDMLYVDFLRITNNNCCTGLKVKVKDWWLGNTHKSPLSTLYSELNSRPSNDVWEKAVINYVNHPFNGDGFRSIPFRNDTTKRKKVLVIGDSFVYGFKAIPAHASFTDCLLAKGYMLYTAGIPGTDPAQYAAIARKYIPVIKPDLVIMCFYEGNDFMMFDRKVDAKEPIEYLTNAGFYQSAPYGSFMSMQDCYNHYKSLITIPTTDTKGFNSLMSKTVVSSLFWGLLHKFRMVRHLVVEESQTRLKEMYKNNKTEYTAKHINAFNTACMQSNVTPLYVYIPDPDKESNTTSQFVAPDTAKARMVFGNLLFHTPMHFQPKLHYHNNDYHFNTAGSLAFAQYLDTLITQAFTGQGLFSKQSAAE